MPCPFAALIAATLMRVASWLLRWSFGFCSASRCVRFGVVIMPPSKPDAASDIVPIAHKLRHPDTLRSTHGSGRSSLGSTDIIPRFPATTNTLSTGRERLFRRLLVPLNHARLSPKQLPATPALTTQAIHIRPAVALGVECAPGSEPASVPTTVPRFSRPQAAKPLALS